MTSAVPILRTAKLTTLSAEQAVANWNAIEPLLSKSLPYALGRVSMEDVKDVVAKEMGMIVIGWDPTTSEVYVAFFCEIQTYKTGRKCFHISLAGGREIGEWIHLWPVLKKIGKDQDCDHIEISGRPGWGRVLGLREVSRMYVEDL